MQEFKDGSTVFVDDIPECDICGHPAEYDAKTKQGPWGYLCATDFAIYGIGLGLGVGQKLVLRTQEVG